MKEICSLEIETNAILSHKTVDENSIIIELKGGITLFIHANMIGLFSSESVLTKEFDSIKTDKITLVETDLSAIMENMEDATIN